MTEVRELLVLKKRIKYLFIVMKKMNILNQYKIIKFIERHIVTIKKAIKIWKNSRLRHNKKTLDILASNENNMENLYCENDKNDDSIENIAVSPGSGSYFNNDFHDNLSTDFKIKANMKIESDLGIESNDNTYNLLDEYDKISQSNQIVSEDEQEFETDIVNTEIKTKRQGCIICKETFATHDSLIDHISKHNGTPQSCIKCKSFFKNATFFKYHLSKNSLIPCFKCEKENFKSISIDELLFCPYCGRKYSNTFNLRRHVQICDFLTKTDSSDNIYVCNLCLWQSRSKDDYGRHYLKHAKNQCLQCDISFTSRKLLREHNTKHTKSSSTKYYCEVCKISFSNRRLCREHMRIFKYDVKHIENKHRDKSANKIWCKPCQQSFIDEKTYKRHCSRQNHLKICKQDVPNIKSFICEKCGLTLKNKERLTDHMSSMHKFKETLMCESCPYTTTKSSNMVRHKQVRHKNAPKEHACDKCPALFSTLSGLKDHMTSVHSSDRPHTCDLCNKTFKLQSQLKRHKVIHNPILTYSCMYCAMGFRRRSYLKRHVISKHEEYMQNDINTLEFKSNKKAKTLQPRTTASQLPNMQDDQMYPLIDVQSGELVLLSVKDISKNNVINMATENDLLNGVHMPDTWTSSENGLYCMDPILESDRNPQPFILPSNNDIGHSIAEVQPDYVHFAQPNSKDIEMLSNGFGIVKENVLTQNSINPEMIVTDPNCNNCLNFCSMVME